MRRTWKLRVQWMQSTKVCFVMRSLKRERNKLSIRSSTCTYFFRFDISLALLKITIDKSISVSNFEFGYFTCTNHWISQCCFGIAWSSECCFYNFTTKSIHHHSKQLLKINFSQPKIWRYFLKTENSCQNSRITKN